MILLPIVAVAVGVLALAAWLLALRRGPLLALAAALTFGLAGYVLQGSPWLGGAPGAAARQVDPVGTAMIEARQVIGGWDGGAGARMFLVIGDGLARRGEYADAATVLLGAVERAPGDAEGWVALGNVLVAQAGGALTPAAEYAFARARAAQPRHPGAPYFLGVALIRNGRLDEAGAQWSRALALAPTDAQWRPMLATQFAALRQARRLPPGNSGAAPAAGR